MLAAAVSSPGCWMFTNSVSPSGVSARPVISHFFGPSHSEPARASVTAHTGERGDIFVISAVW
jgi:hypothetical protein